MHLGYITDLSQSQCVQKHLLYTIEMCDTKPLSKLGQMFWWRKIALVIQTGLFNYTNRMLLKQRNLLEQKEKKILQLVTTSTKQITSRRHSDWKEKFLFV